MKTLTLVTVWLDWAVKRRARLRLESVAYLTCHELIVMPPNISAILELMVIPSDSDEESYAGTTTAPVFQL